MRGYPITTATLDSLLEKTKGRLIGRRRHLHRNPEVSFHEKQTTRFVRETLEPFWDLEISRPTENSVVARLVGRKPGRILALRADIDPCKDAPCGRDDDARIGADLAGAS